MDADGDDAAGAEIGLVQSEASGGAKLAGVATSLFADEPSLAVAVLPGGELFGMPFRRPQRAVGPGDDGADRRGVKYRMRGHAVLHRWAGTKPPPGEPGGGGAIEKAGRYSAASR